MPTYETLPPAPPLPPGSRRRVRSLLQVAPGVYELTCAGAPPGSRAGEAAEDDEGLAPYGMLLANPGLRSVPVESAGGTRKGLQGADHFRLRPLLPLGGLELNPLILFQASVSVGLDG